MHSILLVEDEKIELDTLKNYVDWKSCGIDRVFTARGGRSALQCVAEVEPDIIITDIQMPGMTGIELADIARQEGYDCKIIFLTGFERFDYAKEAVRLQAEDFLLKPFQIDEVERVTKKTIEKIEKEKFEKNMNRRAVGDVLEKICQGDIEEADKMAVLCFQKPADQVFFSLLAIGGLTEAGRRKLNGMAEVVHCFRKDGLMFTILTDAISGEIFMQRIRKMSGRTDITAICRTGKVGLKELAAGCLAIEKCAGELFFMPAGTIVYTDDYPQRRPFEDRISFLTEKNELSSAILNDQEEEAKRILGHILEGLQDMDRQGYCQNAFSLFLFLHRQFEEMDDLDGQAAVPNILQAESAAQLKEQFDGYISSCCGAVSQRKGSRWYTYVKIYVLKHYMEDCTVEEMAEEMKVSPNYLRRKFKEESGMTVLEYVTDTRLSVAAYMLKEKQMKAKDVGPAVGYPNLPYFTQLFAKKYGVTPNEYKKIH